MPSGPCMPLLDTRLLVSPILPEASGADAIGAQFSGMIHLGRSSCISPLLCSPACCFYVHVLHSLRAISKDALVALSAAPKPASILHNSSTLPESTPSVLPDGDLRGPCPRLNAMANHNYIPHNGVVTFTDAILQSNLAATQPPDHSHTCRATVCTPKRRGNYIGKDVLRVIRSFGGTTIPVTLRDSEYVQNLPLTTTDEGEFEEAIEVSGGSKISLARLCVNHVKCVMQPVAISVGVFSMQGVVSLLQARCEVDASFWQILNDQGIASTLTSAACRFSSPPFSAHDNLFNISGFGHNVVTEALRAGILRALLTWGRMNPLKAQSLERVDRVLATLSGSLLRASINDLEIPIDDHIFQGFPVSDKWEAFWSILQRRY
ncbi:hypothetical protein B0H14DRAFT_2643568 [Mycena olivaceomarginata]|nr:hypothetical protein B0H14DRAFT_2643568 [Mycena olivaceomarginata]